MRAWKRLRYPENTAFVIYRNKKIYSPRTQTYINNPEVIRRLQAGEKGIVWCDKTKKDITAKLLAYWISRKFFDALVDSSSEELLTFLNELPVETPSYYQTLSEIACRGRKSYAKTREIQKQNKDSLGVKGWGLKKIRAFYQIKNKKDSERACLRCERFFISEQMKNYLCDRCKEKNEFQGFRELPLLGA